MNENEWLASVEPLPMLKFLTGKASDRKLRLFAWGLLPKHPAPARPPRSHKRRSRSPRVMRTARPLSRICRAMGEKRDGALSSGRTRKMLQREPGWASAKAEWTAKKATFPEATREWNERFDLAWKDYRLVLKQANSPSVRRGSKSEKTRNSSAFPRRLME